MCGRKEVRGNKKQSKIGRCVKDSGRSQRQCDYFQNTCYLCNTGGSKCLHELSVPRSPSCCSGASHLGPCTSLGLPTGASHHLSLQWDRLHCCSLLIPPPHHHHIYTFMQFHFLSYFFFGYFHTANQLPFTQHVLL